MLCRSEEIIKNGNFYGIALLYKTTGDINIIKSDMLTNNILSAQGESSLYVKEISCKESRGSNLYALTTPLSEINNYGNGNTYNPMCNIFVDKCNIALTAHTTVTGTSYLNSVLGKIIMCNNEISEGRVVDRNLY